MRVVQDLHYSVRIQDHLQTDMSYPFHISGKQIDIGPFRQFNWRWSADTSFDFIVDSPKRVNFGGRGGRIGGQWHSGRHTVEEYISYPNIRRNVYTFNGFSDGKSGHNTNQPALFGRGYILWPGKIYRYRLVTNRHYSYQALLSNFSPVPPPNTSNIISGWPSPTPTGGARVYRFSVDQPKVIIARAVGVSTNYFVPFDARLWENENYVADFGGWNTRRWINGMQDGGNVPGWRNSNLLVARKTYVMNRHILYPEREYILSLEPSDTNANDAYRINLIDV